jgi:hypothetical protein
MLTVAEGVETREQLDLLRQFKLLVCPGLLVFPPGGCGRRGRHAGSAAGLVTAYLRLIRLVVPPLARWSIRPAWKNMAQIDSGFRIYN